MLPFDRSTDSKLVFSDDGKICPAQLRIAAQKF
jgi:hypothetical protein